MGLLGRIRRAVGGAAVGLITGGPAGAIVGAARGAARGGRRRQPQLAAPAQLPQLPQRTGGTRRDSTGVTLRAPNLQVPGFGTVQGPQVDFSRVTSEPIGAGSGPRQQATTQSADPTALTQGGFGGDITMQILSQSIGSKTGRSIMEAITSGSLDAGVIQPTTTVSTPRGTENHSPPGFRTVYVNDQPYAVFKPLAKSLGLLPKGGLTERQRLDKIARRYISAQKQYKSLAPKLGLKIEHRKSGPRR